MSKATLLFLVFLASAALFVLAAFSWPVTSVHLTLLGVGVLIFGFAIERAP